MHSASRLAHVVLFVLVGIGVCAFIAIPLTAAPPLRAAASVSEFVSPSESINAVFTDPNNAFANDGNVALRLHTNNTQRYRGYAFTIPRDATIQGIEVRADAWRSAGTCLAALRIGLSADNDVTYTPNVLTSTLDTSDPEGALTLGGASDTWGRVWTPDELNTRFALRVQTYGLTTGCAIALDWIPVRVYYTTPEPTSTPTITPSDTATPISAASTETLTPALTAGLPTATDTPTVSPTDTPTVTPTAFPTIAPTFTNTPVPLPHLVIRQVYAAGGNAGALYNRDYVEIFNADTSLVALIGWSVQYASAASTSGYFAATSLRPMTLKPGQSYLVALFTGTSGAALPEPDASGTTALSTTAGKLALVASPNALAVGGDGCPISLAPVADFVGYGETANCFRGGAAAPAPNATRAIFRALGGCQDSGDNGADFSSDAPAPRNSRAPLLDCNATPEPTFTDTPAATDTPTPVPGTETLSATDTPSSTPESTPFATAAPSSTAVNTPSPTLLPSDTPASFAPLDVVINEVAWSGTLASASDEWIELYNNRDAAMDVTGWTLTDGGDIEIDLRGTIAPRSYYLLERTDDTTVSDVDADQIYTGNLNNAGETLVLRDATGNVIDMANTNGGAWSAGSASPRCSMERRDARAADTPDNWATNDNVRRSGLDAAGNPVCGTPKQPNAATLPPLPTSTPSPTAFSATATPAPAGLFINEFMPDPAQDWNGDGSADDRDEWVEVYNANDLPVDLSNWQLDDVADGGAPPFRVPSGTMIAPRGYAVWFRADTRLTLNNNNDDVRLLHPDGTVADSISYKSSRPDSSWSRRTDGNPAFTLDCPPTPGAANCSIAPTPTLTPTPFARKVVINEFLSAPYRDWNKDGALDSGDEWIELYNAASQEVDLSGWLLDDGRAGSSPFVIPAATRIMPNGFLVFFGSETRIGLDNTGDRVRLLYPDRTLADVRRYTPLETNASEARYPDGGERWVRHCVPTPGRPNCTRNPPPTPTPSFTLVPIAEARAANAGTRVSLLGSVTARPCELDPRGREMTLADDTASIAVYLPYPEALSCQIPRSEQIVVTGVVSDHLGLRTVYLSSNLDVTRHFAPPRPVAPRAVHTGDINETTESALVTIQGAVSNGKNGNVIWVNDGTGMVEVYASPASGASFAGITRGSLVRITGIGYQNNDRKLPQEGYHLRPRSPDDVVILQLADKIERPPRRTRAGPGANPVPIPQALAARNRSFVTVRGVVTAPPGLLGARDFWIQDAGGGAHIYIASNVPLPRLSLGAEVQLRGRVVTAFGAREIRVEAADALKIVGVGQPVFARALGTGQANFANEGLLVTAQGRVTRAQSRELFLDDGSGELRVYINAATGIRLPRLRGGEPIRVTGILSRFDGEPELLPRYTSDLQVGSALLPVTGGAPTSVHVGGKIGDERAPLAFARVGQRLRAAAAGAKNRAARAAAPATVPANGFDLSWLAFGMLGSAGALGILAGCAYRRRRKE